MKETFIKLNDGTQPLYMRVYGYYKGLIADGRLSAGAKLPSVRRCASELNVSRTTVEAAYLQLAADGYIISRPQSGYYVTDVVIKEKKKSALTDSKEQGSQVIFDFASLKADRESFDFDLWRRYLKSALRQDDRLLSYGVPQGERELREVIAKYISEKRNVVCDADNIVIGAGVQSLLHILCGILRPEETICFKDKTFYEGIAIFKDHRFNICDDENDADILYVSPSHTNKWGDIMTTEKRLELIRRAEENNMLLIEDDYDSEFGYFNHPTPSLQGLAAGKNVVYIGTFSKLLLPSIRISFMILPDSLMSGYKAKKSLYIQTVSTTEQIALCQFIRDGHLSGRIRKVKKLYTQKAMELRKAIDKTFGKTVKTHMGETGFVIRMELDLPMSSHEVQKKALEAGIAVIDGGENSGKPQIMLSCSSVKSEDFERSIKLLKNCLTSKND